MAASVMMGIMMMRTIACKTLAPRAIRYIRLTRGCALHATSDMDHQIPEPSNPNALSSKTLNSIRPFSLKCQRLQAAASLVPLRVYLRGAVWHERPLGV